jgi:predicted alpha/beta superfamily hydrolase
MMFRCTFSRFARMCVTCLTGSLVFAVACHGRAGVAERSSTAAVVSTKVAATDTIPAFEFFTLPSAALHEQRRVNVHFPAGYAASRIPLPVLYMPDGGIDEDFPHVTRAVDSLVTLHRIRPFIVVGVPNTERRRDLTGPTHVKSDSAIAPHVGGSGAFRRFLRDELLPAINARYPTTNERAIIGESLAGLFVMETFLEEPTLFTHYVALDPSVWWNAGMIVDSARTRIVAFGPAPRSLFVATSMEPSTAVGFARIAALLRAQSPAGLRWAYVPRTDLEHGNIFRHMQAEALEHALR